ncbi:MAG TPA: cupredoxin domain-containing protein [Solirubrobacterales bacterium]|nr:cupredoxin domain-containing protein [Solirubrobacterales bacterium]
MKKLVTLFALLLAALALAACGGGDDTTGDTSPAAGAVEDVEEGAEDAKEEVEDKAGEAKDEVEGAKDDAEGGSADSGATFDVEADPDGGLAYTTDEASAKAGKVTVNFTNSSPVPHDVRIEDSGGEDVGGTEVISESNESASVNLKPGEYTFYCSVPGHRQGGMEGKLTAE